MITRDELAGWLRLLQSRPLGRESMRKLLAAFGSPEAAIAATTAARVAVVGPAAAASLNTSPEGLDALVETTWRWLHDALADGAAAHDVLTLGDPRYPPALLHSADPPLLLYASGQLDLLGRPALAVVGSRSPTPQGVENARAFSSHLSQSGLCIVSGLAMGIDGAAHEGGLAGGGSTIAVVGTGLDTIYPRRHAALGRRIAEQGLLLSEYPLGTPPLAVNFPSRNRIIAGLAGGTLVVEAALQSGSLITARLALESDREVFAIPGSIHSPQSRGCHALIKQGAKLVETAQDVLEELHLPLPATADSSDEAPANPLLDALGHEPTSLEALVDRTGWSAAELNVRLLDLELEGRVARLPGQRFQRVNRA